MSKQLFAVPVRRQVLLKGTALVMADDSTGAREAAAEKVEQGSVRLEAIPERMSLVLDMPMLAQDKVLPSPTLLEAYRQYVLAAAKDPLYPIATLPSYEGWKQTALVGMLTQLIAFYGIDEEALDEIVHDAKGNEAAAVNNGGFEEQVRFLLEAGGYEGVRQVIIHAAEQTAEELEGEQKPDVD